MVDFARIQNRIYYGYGKAAIRLGTEHSIYRSPDGINPIQENNFIGTQLVSMDQDYKYTKQKKYGDAVWQILPEDGLSLNNYDFLVGPTITYYIVDIHPDDRLSPPLVVECNATINLIDPKNSLSAGTNSYQQLKTGNPILLNCPCSILQYTRFASNNMKLPSSVPLPHYEISLPDFDDVFIKTGQLIYDTNGRKFAVINAERTKKNLGFRILASLEAT